MSPVPQKWVNEENRHWIDCCTLRSMSLEPKLTPTEQLQLLEDTYANLLMEEAGKATLTTLWNQIKKLRQQLDMPIHYNLDGNQSGALIKINNMKKVMLQFKTTQDLISFQKVISCCAYRIDMPNLILTCDCGTMDVSKAINEFGATVVELPFSVL